MKILSNIQNDKDIVSKEYVDSHTENIYDITSVNTEDNKIYFSEDVYTYIRTNVPKKIKIHIDHDSASFLICDLEMVAREGGSELTPRMSYQYTTCSDGLQIVSVLIRWSDTASTGSRVTFGTAGTSVERVSTTPTGPTTVLWVEDSDIDGSGGGGGSSIEVIDSLISTSTTDALSANQGRVLNGKITTIENDYLTSTNIKDNLTTDSATDALSAKQGKALNTRLAALEGDNLDSRLDTLEGQNLDSRLDTIEAKNLVESTNISKIVMVTEYPSTPDPDTLYVKVASL